ncbi:MAG: hypothetical protein EOO63_15625 [Hymenobacter sp.]|nr:MAG: hypothetical protein EOO63_15625 [Hymenobacter sp.]
MLNKQKKMLSDTFYRALVLGAVVSGSGALQAVAQTALNLPPAQPWSDRSEGLIAKPGDEWITPAEAANFETPPRYAEVRT